MLRSPNAWEAFSPATRRFLVGSALMGAAWAVPWTLLSLYLDRLGYTKAEIGAVQACEAWGKVLIAIPIAFLLARRRTPPILVASSLCAAAAYACLPWMRAHAAVMACNLLAGLAWSVHYVAIAPFLYRHAEPGRRAAVFGVAEAVHTGAAVVGAFACGRAVTILTRVYGSETRALALALSAAGAVALAAAWPYATIEESDVESRGREAVPSADRRAIRRGAADERVNDARERELEVRSNALEPGVERPLEPALRALEPSVERPRGVLEILRASRERGALLRFALPQLIIASGAGLCIPFLGLYFQDRFAMSPGDVGSLYSAGQVLMTLGFLMTPVVLRRLGYVKSIVVLELCSIPFFLVLAFTRSPWVAVLAFLMRGMLMNSATPVLKHFSMHAIPPRARELQNGVTSLMNGLGWVFGPQIGGALLDASGSNYKTLMCTTVGFYVAAASVTLWLLRPLERADEPIAAAQETRSIA
jgi:hypothetical protein